MNELIVLIFDDDLRADEVLLAVLRAQRAGELAIVDAAVATKSTRGRLEIRQTTRIPIGRGDLANGWWGLLITLLIGGPAGRSHYGVGFDALYGKLGTLGADEAFCYELSESVEPGNSVLFALASQQNVAQTVRQLRRFNGSLMHTKLPESCAQAVRDTLGRAEQVAIVSPESDE
jgi:uncharacterized membrane protein